MRRLLTCTILQNHKIWMSMSDNTSVKIYRSIVKNYEIILLYYYKHNFHASLL